MENINTTEPKKPIWDEFTNLYSLQKTLRFELKPVGKNGERMSTDDAKKVFADILKKDREIRDAYIALKPIMDKVHEQVIDTSLTSDKVKEIDFSKYFKKYQLREKLKSDEELLRKAIVETFDFGAEKIIEQSGINKKGKPVFKNKGVKCLTEAGILQYIKNHLDELTSDETKRNEVEKCLKTFEKFFTYFSGYNQNRENYYAKEEKATAVATRIVHENLPKFCDNIIQFSHDKTLKKKNSNETITIPSRKEEYLKAYKFLKDAGKETKIKDAEKNEYIEAYPIEEKLFDICEFSNYLSQSRIEEYNRIIGHYNLLINLYNQARKEEKDFKKLETFKTLFKQIGCGEKKALFNALKYDTKEQQDAKEKTDEILSVKEALKIASEAGKKHFTRSSDERVSIHTLIDWLKEAKDWDGVYWSKVAINKISSRYLANWYDIQDRLEGGLRGKDKQLKEIYQTVASYKKSREEILKINDVVELPGLFQVIDTEQVQGWSEIFFKESVLEEKKSLINENLSPSQNLINLICSDMEILAKDFCSESEAIQKITDYKNESNILQIKEWLDKAKFLLWLVKYFEVKESKVKGNPLNPELSNMLTALLHAEDAEWFDWYDAVRNYLTKKPQDDVKKNKLKLNFGNPILLGGWSDGQEKNKGAVLLRNSRKYYVGILHERAIFDTTKNNPIYNASVKNAGRLILRNLAFKTLAGKGFVRDYKEKYGDMGKRDPQLAVQNLQNLITKQYAQQYPPLRKVLDKQYSDKKVFDKDVKDILTECYECTFEPIDWNIVLKYIADGKMYLFEIFSKDFSEKRGVKSKGKNPNLQTKYWEHLFQDNSTIQLCGGGEIFFREKAIDDDKKIIHPANQSIRRRSDGKTESRFSHDIVRDKRFTVEKYFFHIPIKINYQSPEQSFINGKVNLRLYNNINEEINNVFTRIENIQFLGIDRGEKHLIYYSLIDAKGNIIEQNHFDVINNKDYLQEINKSVERRREKQENWQQKGNISNLKDGYISLVIHEIIQKMKDKGGNFRPTFIVLEDLNPGFKRGRQKFEQQVYQKFELALAKKLNFLVDKNVSMGEIGSVAKALQLTPPVVNYQDIEKKKQLGIMLYTRANYTSVTDPATGWRKNIYLKKGKEEDIEKQILETFSEIKLDENNDYFFDYTDKNTGNSWRMWSGKNGKSLERYRFRRGKGKNEGIIESYSPKEMLDKLFADFDQNESLKKQLKDGKTLRKINDKNTPWESLRFVIDIIQQIRNSGDTKKDQDDNFLQSPVRTEQGEHFDSREYTKQENPQLPKDADANGAYNIAHKGIIMYEHIRQWMDDGKQIHKKYPDLDLFISDAEWDLWACNRKEWKRKVQFFASRKLKQKEKNEDEAGTVSINSSSEVPLND